MLEPAADREPALNSLVPSLERLQVRNVHDPDLAEFPVLNSLALPLQRYIHSPTKHKRASRSHNVSNGVALDCETEVGQLRHYLQR